MITAAQGEYIEDHAYVPEHIPDYVTAVSQAEPYLIGDFIAYVKTGHLILVGYPLKERFEEKRLRKVFEGAVKRFRPESVSVIGPSIPPSLNRTVHPPSDHYYLLNLSSLSIAQKLRNMLKRAGRELSVDKTRSYCEEHKKMVEGFLKSHPVDEATRSIFERIDKYLSSSKTAWIFQARDKGNELVAFDVAEFESKSYCFYMFNFASDARYVPGVSDLLLSEVIQEAKNEKKKFINLGLGINAGVTFFKKKWGGSAFLPYACCLFYPSTRESLETLLHKL